MDSTKYIGMAFPEVLRQPRACRGGIFLFGGSGQLGHAVPSGWTSAVL